MYVVVYRVPDITISLRTSNAGVSYELVTRHNRLRSFGVLLCIRNLYDVGAEHNKNTSRDVFRVLAENGNMLACVSFYT